MDDINQQHTPVQQPQPSGFTSPDRQPEKTPSNSGGTNLFAILSLVCAVLFVSLLSLIFGIIGLGQIKKSGEKGKGLAIAGIVISVLQMIGIVVFILLSIFAVIGSNNLTNINELKNDTQSITQPTEAKPKKPVEVGQTATTGKFEMKVTSAGEAEPREDSFSRPLEGKRYYRVDLEVTNKGDSTSYIYNTLFKIHDEKGKDYSYSLFALPNGVEGVDGEIKSNQKVKGSIGFEIPEDSTGLVLYFEDPSFRAPTATVKLPTK